MAHAPFPPSSSYRWLACPYSVPLSKKFLNKSGPAAEEGTRQHAIAAKALITDADVPDDRMRTYLNCVRGYCLEPGYRSMAVEQEVIVIPGKCWGTPDAQIIGDDWLVIPDLKWGKDPVQAINNPQLKTYGVGVAKKHSMPAKTRVTLVIAQPNVASGWPVKVWNTTVAKLREFEGEIERAIEEAEKPNPKAVAGNHCYWCPGKLHCTAFRLQPRKKS